MKRQNRWNLLVLLTIVPLVLGCASSSPGKPYTLRVVFSGLVPLVPSDETTTPDALWALIPDLEDTSHLSLGHQAHGHRNRLLFDPDQVTIDAGGRETHDDGWACDCDGNEETWSYITPGDGRPEHLQLAVVTPETSLRMNRGPLQLPVPCDPADPTCNVQGRSLEDQARDIQWAVNVDGIVEQLFPADDLRPRFRAGMVKPAYADGNGARPLVKVRYRFDRGLVQARTLHRSDSLRCDSDIETFTVTRPAAPLGSPPLMNQAVARELEVVVRVRGDIAFTSSDLTDPSVDRPPIVFRRKPGQKEVVLRIDNEPDVDSCPALRLEALNAFKSPEQLHFLTLYNLLDHPEVLPTPTSEHRLSPVAGEQLTAWNAQCSPPRFQLPN